MVGRNKIIKADDVYEAMLDLHDNNEKITWNKIAKMLNCSERTVIRNIDNELKKEKELLNQNNEKI
jgi:transcriptional antiterminator